jgi:hypothetical protein
VLRAAGQFARTAPYPSIVIQRWPRRSSAVPWIVSLTAAWALAGCDVVAEPSTTLVRPTPTPGPPSIRFASRSTLVFDGHVWTLYVVVDPKGEPTDVVAEYGTGTEEGPFDHTIVIADDVLDAGQISAQTSDLPADGGFCLRFTATNRLGSASTDANCRPAIRPPPS